MAIEYVIETTVRRVVATVRGTMTDADVFGYHSP
jgi:hypothetical protein